MVEALQATGYLGSLSCICRTVEAVLLAQLRPIVTKKNKFYKSQSAIVGRQRVQRVYDRDFPPLPNGARRRGIDGPGIGNSPTVRQPSSHLNARLLSILMFSGLDGHRKRTR